MTDTENETRIVITQAGTVVHDTHTSPDLPWRHVLKQTIDKALEVAAVYETPEEIRVELHTTDHGLLTVTAHTLEPRKWGLGPRLYFTVTRAGIEIGRLDTKKDEAEGTDVYMLVPSADHWYGASADLLDAARAIAAQHRAPGDAADLLDELGGQRTIMRAELETLSAKMERVARQAYAAGAGLPEAALARRAGVDRMTMRKWLGKGSLQAS